ncbi:MAG: OmpL47-type beta-barrel domain-containing protein [Candidatus Thorarchaeota archaeon]
MKARKLHVVLFLIVIGVLGVSLFIPTDTTIHPLTNTSQKTDSCRLMTEDSISYAECDCEDPDTNTGPSSLGCFIVTDENSYLPTELVTVSGYGFIPQSVVNLTIEKPCACGEHDSHFDTFDFLAIDGEGHFEMNYQHYGTTGIYNITCTDGIETAVHSFIVSTYVIRTDKLKYVAGESVIITGIGFNIESEVNVSIIDPENNTVRWSVMTDYTGNFTTTYTATGVDGRYAVIASDGIHLATTSFRDPLWNNAWLEVSPHFGYSGFPVSVSGWGFEGDGIVYILGEEENLILTTFTAENGHFDTTFIVPEIAPDYYMICASSSKYIEQELCIPWVCFQCDVECVFELFGICLWVEITCSFWECEKCFDAGYYEYFDACIDFPFAIYPSPVVDENPPTTTVELEGTKSCGDWYTSEVLLNLNAVDEITDVMKTSYRVGETGPWIEYTEGFYIDIEGTFHIYYNSTDLAGNVEEPNYVQIKIDWTKPVTTAIPTGTMGLDGWYTTPVSVQLDANDPVPGSGVAETWYQINNGELELYTSPFDLTEDGPYTVTFYSVDTACNEEFPKSIEIKIDKTAPTTVASPTGDHGLNGWYVSQVTVDLLTNDPTPCSGVAYTKYSLDNGDWELFSVPIYINLEGYHNISFYAVDNAGNTEDTGLIELYIDFSKPDTNIIPMGAPGQEGWYVSPVTIYLNANDPQPGSGTSATYYYIDSGPWILYGPPINLPEGEWNIHFYSVDVAGNAELPQSETILVDTSPPETTLVIGTHYTDGDSIYVTTSTTFSFEFIEQPSGVAATWFTINGGSLLQYDGVFTLDGPDGPYTLSYYSKDVAGNVEDSRSKTVILVSLDVSSYITDSEFNPISSFDAVLTKDRTSGGYKLVATNPGQFYYNIEITNDWPIQVDTLTINAEIPTDFVLKGATPIHVYIDGVDITEMCEIVGLTITVSEVPVGSMVYVTIHLDYGIKGSLYETLESFVLTNYQFMTMTSGTSGSPASLEGTYMSSVNLIANQKKTTAVAGFILRQDGTPVVGVIVTLSNSIGESFDAVTDENGFYYFIGIEAGEYTVSVTVDSQIYCETTSATKNELTEMIITVD